MLFFEFLTLLIKFYNPLKLMYNANYRKIVSYVTDVNVKNPWVFHSTQKTDKTKFLKVKLCFETYRTNKVC